MPHQETALELFFLSMHCHQLSLFIFEQWKPFKLLWTFIASRFTCSLEHFVDFYWYFTKPKQNSHTHTHGVLFFQSIHFYLSKSNATHHWFKVLCKRRTKYYLNGLANCDKLETFWKKSTNLCVMVRIRSDNNKIKLGLETLPVPAKWFLLILSIHVFWCWLTKQSTLGRLCGILYGSNEYFSLHMLCSWVFIWCSSSLVCYSSYFPGSVAGCLWFANFLFIQCSSHCYSNNSGGYFWMHGQSISNIFSL